jgi:hypothetical protein
MTRTGCIFLPESSVNQRVAPLSCQREFGNRSGLDGKRKNTSVRPALLPFLFALISASACRTGEKRGGGYGQGKDGDLFHHRTPDGVPRCQGIANEHERSTAIRRLLPAAATAGRRAPLGWHRPGTSSKVYFLPGWCVNQRVASLFCQREGEPAFGIRSQHQDTSFCSLLLSFLLGGIGATRCHTGGKRGILLN